MVIKFNYEFLKKNRCPELDGEYNICDLHTMDVDIKREDREETQEFNKMLDQSIVLTNNEPIRSLWINIDDNGHIIIFDGASRFTECKNRGWKKIRCEVWKGLMPIQMMLGNYQENVRRPTTFKTMIELGKQLQNSGFTNDEIISQLVIPNKNMDYVKNGLELSDDVLKEQGEIFDGEFNVKAISYMSQAQKIGVDEEGQVEVSKIFKEKTKVENEHEAEKTMYKLLKSINKTKHNKKMKKDFGSGKRLVREHLETIDNSKTESPLTFPEDSEKKIPVLKKIMGNKNFEKTLLLWAEKPYRYTESDKFEGETKIVLDHTKSIAIVNTLDTSTIGWAREYGGDKGLTVIDKDCDACYAISQLEKDEDMEFVYINANGFVGYRPALLGLLKKKYPNSILVALVNYNGQVLLTKKTEAVSVYGVNDIENLEHLKTILKTYFANAEFYDTKDNQCMMVIR